LRCCLLSVSCRQRPCVIIAIIEAGRGGSAQEGQNVVLPKKSATRSLVDILELIFAPLPCSFYSPISEGGRIKAKVMLRLLFSTAFVSVLLSVIIAGPRTNVGPAVAAQEQQLDHHRSTKSIATSNMNEGVVYTVANSAAAAEDEAASHRHPQFQTDYAGKEYFDVYSNPIRTLYSQVHWRAHSGIKLPPEIVDRFASGKVMAVTGYEVDQVRTTVTDDDGGGVADVPVPITYAYNHHYTAFLTNSHKVRVVENNNKEDHDNHGQQQQQSHRHHRGLLHASLLTVEHVRDENSEDGETQQQEQQPFPAAQFFSEANGGEMRTSYHGYPQRYAQLIESPDHFHVTPMQM
jgi:hypothetical protein